MLHVFPLQDDKKELFGKLFAAYYSELGCDDDCGRLLDDYIIPDILAGLIRVDLLSDDGSVCGFVIYQTDDVTNDWNKKEGWGDIREIYIVPAFRKRGNGKFLLYTAEMKLKESGTSRSYCLPAEGSEEFFTACGYRKTENFDEEMNAFIYEKQSLENGCKR